jgi:hypothetical protein
LTPGVLFFEKKELLLKSYLYLLVIALLAAGALTIQFFFLVPNE